MPWRDGWRSLGLKQVCGSGRGGEGEGLGMGYSMECGELGERGGSGVI